MVRSVSNALLSRLLHDKRPIARLSRENEARRGEHLSMGVFHRHQAFVAYVVLVSVSFLCCVLLAVARVL